MSIKSMDVTTLQEKIANGAEIILIDCREQDEWDQGHIEQAKFMALSVFAENLDQLKGNENKEIIMQCRSGKRSMRACEILADQDFTELYNLEGGILAWQEAGFPVVK